MVNKSYLLKFSIHILVSLSIFYAEIRNLLIAFTLSIFHSSIIKKVLMFCVHFQPIRAARFPNLKHALLLNIYEVFIHVTQRLKYIFVLPNYMNYFSKKNPI